MQDKTYHNLWSIQHDPKYQWILVKSKVVIIFCKKSVYKATAMSETSYLEICNPSTEGKYKGLLQTSGRHKLCIWYMTEQFYTMSY